jgi:mono/diheme cytochrome c family protein
MLTRCTRALALAGSIALVGSGVLVFQGTATPQDPQEKTVKKVPIPRSDPTSGKQMYKDYCAACHGPDGKGVGPATEFLKAPPPDLTTMAKRNNGKFPDSKFSSILRFGTSDHPHGTLDMPVWGPLFTSQSSGNRAVGELRIHNLAAFVESIQEK